MTKTHGDRHISIYSQNSVGKSQLDSDYGMSLLVDFIHLLSSFFLDRIYWDGTSMETSSFDQLVRNMTELKKIQGSGSVVRVHYQGTIRKGKVQKEDYLIHFGLLSLDSMLAEAIVLRKGIRYSHLTGRLGKAFDVLKAYKIYHLVVNLGELSTVFLSRLRLCLEIISRFKGAIQNNTPIVSKEKNKTITFPLIRDLDLRVDLNLTMLAAINNLSEDQMNQLIRQSQNVLIGSGDKKDRKEEFTESYSLISSERFVSENLIMLPIEINPQASMISESNILKKSDSVKIGDDPHAETETVAAENQLPYDIYEDLSELMRREKEGGRRIELFDIRTLINQDYSVLKPFEIGESFERVSDLIEALEKSEDGEKRIEWVINQFGERLKEINSSFWKKIDLKDNHLHILTERSGDSFRKPHSRIGHLISACMNRAHTQVEERLVFRRKTLSLGNHMDFEMIANDYGIYPDDVKNIMRLITSCFDERKHFLKKSFEQVISEFMKYDKIIFEFLWSFLGETICRGDRVILLNSLQKLVDRLAQPKKALTHLLNEILYLPHMILFADRNAFLLANLLVRKYNKELHMNIELTPEEVLLVENGLDRDVIGYVRRRLDADENKFSDKLSAIHDHLVEAAEFGSADEGRLSSKFLISLEREVFIFLSLIGGGSALRLISRQMSIYCNPQSAIYGAIKEESHYADILNHFKLLLKSFGRIGEKKDIVTLEEFMKREKAFMNMMPSSSLKGMVTRSVRQAESSIRKISQSQR